MTQEYEAQLSPSDKIYFFGKCLSGGIFGGKNIYSFEISITDGEFIRMMGITVGNAPYAVLTLAIKQNNGITLTAAEMTTLTQNTEIQANAGLLLSGRGAYFLENPTGNRGPGTWNIAVRTWAEWFQSIEATPYAIVSKI